MMTSASRAASAGDRVGVAPADASESIAAGTISNARTAKPPFSTFSAIGRPIVPRPMNATGLSTILGSSSIEEKLGIEVLAGRDGVWNVGDSREKVRDL